MKQLIVSVFDTKALAEAAENDLINDGISRHVIHRYAPGDAAAPVIRERPAKTTASAMDFLFGLVAEDVAGSHDNAPFKCQQTVTLAVCAVDGLEAAEVTQILEGWSPTLIEIQTTTRKQP